MRADFGRVIAASAFLVVAGAMGAGAGAAVASTGDGPTAASPAARGVSFAGLSKGDAGCERAYRVHSDDGVVRCTHGPDPAPAGVDTRRDRSVAELRAETATGTTASTSAAVPCYGDGTTGKRVQAVYAHAADVTSRYADLLPLIRQWGGTVDGIVARSAAKTGGVRHVRWVTTPGCELDVLDIALSRTGDDTFANTQSELARAGLTRTDRKYLIWVDAGVYCGVGNFTDDDSTGARNKSNVGPSYARIDRGCWGYADSTEAHELFHMLGSVQYSAPNSSGGGHCLDEHDLLCYADSMYVQTRDVCDFAAEQLLDCGDDDYFNTAPATGSYLATHWNTANNEFLTSETPGVPSPDASPSPSPSPSASPSPTASATSSPTPSPTATGKQKGGGKPR